MIELNFIIVGSSSCGKTSLVTKLFKEDSTTEQPASNNSSYSSGSGALLTQYKRVLPQMMCKVWDIPGGHEFDRFRPLMYHGIDAVIICFALDSIESFHEVDERWIPELNHYFADGGGSSSDDTNFLIGCKKDKERRISFEDCNELAKLNNLTYFEFSTSDETQTQDEILLSIVKKCIKFVENPIEKLTTSYARPIPTPMTTPMPTLSPTPTTEPMPIPMTTLSPTTAPTPIPVPFRYTSSITTSTITGTRSLRQKRPMTRKSNTDLAKAAAMTATASSSLRLPTSKSCYTAPPLSTMTSTTTRSSYTAHARQKPQLTRMNSMTTLRPHQSHQPLKSRSKCIIM